MMKLKTIIIGFLYFKFPDNFEDDSVQLESAKNSLKKMSEQ